MHAKAPSIVWHQEHNFWLPLIQLISVLYYLTSSVRKCKLHNSTEHRYNIHVHTYSYSYSICTTCTVNVREEKKPQRFPMVQFIDSGRKQK